MTAHFLPRVVQEEQNSRRSFDFAQDDGFIFAACERQKRVLRFAQDDNSFLAAGGAGRTKQPQVLRLRFAPLRMTASFLLPARDRSGSFASLRMTTHFLPWVV